MAFCACALPPPPPLSASLQVRVCSCSLARRGFRSFRLVDPTAEEQDGAVEPRRVETGDQGAGEGGNGFVSRLGVALTPFLCSWCTLSALYISPEATENDHIADLTRGFQNL
ncbi:uncharacterized protein [Bos taurus]|uniref:uncharacterized protein isoform X7 n=1 Tax=Bos taurus TaxID=9913 RepID=UPI000572CD26|nr:uncharacterized protein LOC104970913 isoform X7 [Bos taurus]